MKKIFLSMSMALAVAVTGFAAVEPEVNEKVKESFKREFSGAQLLGWSEQGEFYKATFIVAGSRAEAYFTADGELAGTIRSVFYNQLPLAVITAVEKRFSQIAVLDLYEITNVNGTAYRLTLESDNKKYRVRTDAAGNIADVEKLKK
jgi:hypothetical protein